MTDTERIELIRAIIFKGGKVSPAAIIEAIKPIVGEPPAPAVVHEQETRTRGNVTVLPVKGQEGSQGQQHDRFLTLNEICQRCAITPGTVRNYRFLGKHKDLAKYIPPLIQRGDRRLGCLQSTLDAWLAERYDNQGGDKIACT